MMSAALVMTVEGEQTNMRSSATSGGVVIGEMSFAQSFGERTGLAVNMRTMNGAVDASSETRGGKNSELVKSSDALPLALTGARPNTVVVQRMTEANEAKNASGAVANGTGKTAVVDTNLVALANAADRGQSKTTTVQLLADRGEVQKNIGANVVAQTGVSQTKALDAAAAIENEEQPVGNESPAAVANDEFAAESTTVGTLSGDEVEPIAQNGTLPAPKVLDVDSARKDAKTQEGSAGAKTASKPTGTMGNAKPVGDASTMTWVQGAIPLSVQVAEPSDAQPSAVGVTAANVSGVVVATAVKLAVGTSTTGSDNTGRKALARAGKDDEVEAAGQGVKPTADATVATGFGLEIDKAAVVTSAAEKDVDGKGLSAIGAVVLVHGVTENESVAPGTVTGMPFTHTSAEVSGTKVQAGEAGAHATTPYAGLVEQNGPAVTGEMGMSHRTLLATPMALEVGVANGTQGWLKIRAEMTDGGVVNASLSSATSAGQEMLHRELPALTAYLQDERVAVNTVVIPASAAAGSESRFAGEMDGNGGGQSQQSSDRRSGDERQGPIHGIADRGDEIPAGMGWEGAGHEGLLSAGTYAGGGSWLNVRA
jgi:hypothetical protein